MSALMVRALKIIAAAGVLTAGGFACPLSAHADDPCNNDAPGCPRFGHLVCEQMDNGLSAGQVAANAMVAYNLSKIMAASLVSGAIVKYCPWDEGQ
jgi:Protein of unknown function (DUF732)